MNTKSVIFTAPTYLRQLLPMLLLLVSSNLVAERPAWTTSRITGAPTAPMPYEVKRVFGDYQFKQPVELSSATHTDSMFLLELDGSIFELPSESSSKPVLIGEFSEHINKMDQSLGLAFHPDFEKNREIYVCYRFKPGDPNGTVLSRFRLTDSQPMQIEKGSEEIVYRWLSGGHNGGSVQFGPDGYLYISAGDSAAPFPPDPLKAGQDLSNLLSTITRIDVDDRDGELPYGIPADNPFIDLDGARPEIYAYGFRNPWRMAFDRQTRDLWVGDVGWELWEMIHRVESGGNYGWSLVEGPHTVNRDFPQGPTPVSKPAASHPHTEARSITGGQVYYGASLPELRGKYIYGDHVTGRIWSLKKEGDTYEVPIEIARSPLQIICFGLHNNGEVYIVDYVGSVHKLVARKQETNASFPTKLSESGLFANAFSKDKQLTLASGVLPYSIIAEPWMDGATASRFVGIPDQQQIGVYTVGSGFANWAGQHRGSWKFPKDSVLGKTISLKDRRIETQLMHFDGQAWQAYTYLWNDEQTDAQLADDVTQTIDIDVDGEKKRWLVSNRGDCMICHSNANDMLLGFKPDQLRRPVGEVTDQLDVLANTGLFEKDPPKRDTLVSPQNEHADLTARARSYLHVNCAHCHRPEGGGAVAMSVAFQQSAEGMRMIDEAPLQGTFGIENAKVVKTGDPYRSILLYRFCKLGPGHMPKLGGLEVDQQGATLLHDWIASLGKADDAKKAFDSNVKSLRNAASSNQLNEWLTDATNSMIAAHALRTGTLDASIRKAVLAASQTLPATSKDLFEPFIPISERTERLGDNIDPADILAEGGDAARGRELFMSESLSCKNCHSIERGKSAVGPNLVGLEKTKYRPAVLLENIMHPSKVVEVRYRSHVIQTVDGEVFTGTASEKPDATVLRDAEGKTHRIAKDDIEFRKVSEVSLMPEKLLSPLTRQQAQDLVVFLSTLGTE